MKKHMSNIRFERDELYQGEYSDAAKEHKKNRFMHALGLVWFMTNH